MERCDWNFIMATIAALGSIVAIYLFLRGGIEKLIQKQTDILHKDIMGVKEDVRDIKEDMRDMREDMRNIREDMKEDSKRSNERIDRLYQMFVDLLNKTPSSQPKTEP